MNAVIIQARMSSTRLPGKSMKTLSGKPLLWHVIDRVSRSRKAKRIIVATSTQSEDDAIEKFCRESGTACYRGSLDNVLERYYEAARVYGVETIVRITADCPLIDPEIIDRCVSSFEQSGADYVSNVAPGPRTFPRGLDTEVFSFSVLEKAYRQGREPYEQEHVTPYIVENKRGEFSIGQTVVADEAYAGNFRLVVDYPADYAVLQKLYDVFYEDGAIISVPAVIEFLRTHPDLASRNVEGKPAHIRRGRTCSGEQKPLPPRV